MYGKLSWTPIPRTTKAVEIIVKEWDGGKRPESMLTFLQSIACASSIKSLVIEDTWNIILQLCKPLSQSLSDRMLSFRSDFVLKISSKLLKKTAQFDKNKVEEVTGHLKLIK